jgi:hypothetical protein
MKKRDDHTYIMLLKKGMFCPHDELYGHCATTIQPSERLHVLRICFDLVCQVFFFLTSTKFFCLPPCTLRQQR